MGNIKIIAVVVMLATLQEIVTTYIANFNNTTKSSNVSSKTAAGTISYSNGNNTNRILTAIFPPL